eukprot:m.367232 g.367232  ORF g.367232 m.367232 type:complete len:66 (-) comp20829_c0_seq2:1811-2008(-)
MIVMCECEVCSEPGAIRGQSFVIFFEDSNRFGNADCVGNISTPLDVHRSKLLLLLPHCEYHLWQW